MAGRPTVRGVQGEERWRSYTGAWRGGRKVGSSILEDQWDGRTDPMRGWIIAICWMVASAAESALPSSFFDVALISYFTAYTTSTLSSADPV